MTLDVLQHLHLTLLIEHTMMQSSFKFNLILF